MEAAPHRWNKINLRRNFSKFKISLIPCRLWMSFRGSSLCCRRSSSKMVMEVERQVILRHPSLHRALKRRLNLQGLHSTNKARLKIKLKNRNLKRGRRLRLRRPQRFSNLHRKKGRRTPSSPPKTSSSQTFTNLKTKWKLSRSLPRNWAAVISRRDLETAWTLSPALKMWLKMICQWRMRASSNPQDPNTLQNNINFLSKVLINRKRVGLKLCVAMMITT